MFVPVRPSSPGDEHSQLQHSNLGKESKIPNHYEEITIKRVCECACLYQPSRWTCTHFGKCFRAVASTKRLVRQRLERAMYRLTYLRTH